MGQTKHSQKLVSDSNKTEFKEPHAGWGEKLTSVDAISRNGRSQM